MLYLSFLIINLAYSGMADVFGGKSSSSGSRSSGSSYKSHSVFGGSSGSGVASGSVTQVNSGGSLKKVFSDNKTPSSTKTSNTVQLNSKNKGSKTNYIGGVESFTFPTKKPNITSYYGWRSGKRFHDGIDLSGKKGDNILASAMGVVIYSASRISGYGKMVVIKHPSGYSTVYAHNDRNKVNKGEKVKKGQVIASMGQTGRATGVHLHFEIRDQGGYSKDPAKYLK